MYAGISDLKILPLENGKYLKPFRMKFTQNGKERDWECVKAMSSVSALLYHTQMDSFLLVKQFRPAVWYSQHEEGIATSEPGYTYELCAGLLDKGISKEQTIKEEILEECGYAVSDVTPIVMTYGAFGFSGNTQSMFYATIDESMRVNSGGGVAGEEEIELVFIPRLDMLSFLFDESKPKGFGLLFAYFWWEKNLKEKFVTP
ncbi:NUDIX hydrolase [Campylobacter mucosalis]|uniref:NUDIX hydrolase n=1 Tax=Campylobacter mucosalis TaxID=202 RepID=UPI0004DA9787|nr:NUDIX hydrolase [Campylobacter mucosalis]KEA45574.1 NUDIX hydrolase [Campylobacter mucosalis]QKF63273.1 Nudix-type nucleoside diphosphatase, YffH/AdpP family [Campylobacter mucosalis]